MYVFRDVLSDVRYGARVSTRLAADIAMRIAIGSVEPLYAQIDPVKLSEMSRAMDITSSYGERLNEYSGNLKGEALVRLLYHYPDHGFVIDRKETETLFERVSDLSKEEMDIYAFFRDHLFDPNDECGPIHFSKEKLLRRMRGEDDEHETTLPHPQLHGGQEAGECESNNA